MIIVAIPKKINNHPLFHSRVLPVGFKLFPEHGFPITSFGNDAGTLWGQPGVVPRTKFSNAGNLILLFLFLFVSTAEARARSSRYLVIPAIFSNDMVLQQKSVDPIWGRADPGSKVIVKTSWGEKAGTIVSRDSIWTVRLRTRSAGGPYELTVSVGDTTATFSNVMLGEVWLCSGQSNMEIPLQGWQPEYPIENSAAEIDSANYPDIRLFTVARAYSVTPDFNCVGKWSECTPRTAAPFSAVGYFFGRKLFKKLHVPIGLISSVWGGTEIQPWIGAKYLSKMRSYRKRVETIESSGSLIAALEKWVKSHPVIDISARPEQDQWKGLDFDDSRCSEVNCDDSLWNTVKLPNFWIYNYEVHAGRFIGAVWFRKIVQIPKNWVDSTLVIDLGPIGGMDETWVNGVKVGGILEPGYDATPRVYDVPGSAVSDTTLTIAIRIPDISSWGGIYGNGVKMEVHPKSDSAESVPLSGTWKFMPVAQYINGKFYVFSPDGEICFRPKVPFAYSENSPTVLYNGMIAPLIPFRIKGVIWYQGESNVGMPYSYRYLFPLLINGWRAAWGEGNFPFYWVQIAPYHYGKASYSYVIRDAQRETLSLPHTGMAVTLDIANPTTIHPTDKQDVGLRLALWALDKNYGLPGIYSGPLYKSMRVRRGKAIISFKYVDGGLVFRPLNGESNFIIAGRDSQFVKAEVRVVGRTLQVFSPKISHPIAVRYTWGNAEESTLFNKAGLPASTFRTDNWHW